MCLGLSTLTGAEQQTPPSVEPEASKTCFRLLAGVAAQPCAFRWLAPGPRTMLRMRYIKKNALLLDHTALPRSWPVQASTADPKGRGAPAPPASCGAGRRTARSPGPSVPSAAGARRAEPIAADRSEHPCGEYQRGRTQISSARGVPEYAEIFHLIYYGSALKTPAKKVRSFVRPIIII